MSDRIARRTMMGGMAAALTAARAAAADPVTIRFAVLGIGKGIGTTYQQVAIRHGIYRKHGVDLKIVSFPRGGPEAVAAAASGQVDIGDVGTPILTAISGGAPLRIIGAPAYKRQPFVLVARPDIRSFADLRHQTVSIASVGGGGDQALNFMLRAHGLGPRDVRQIAIGASNGEYAALKSGRVAAAIMNEPLVSQAVADGSGKVLGRAVDYYGRYEHSYVYATQAFIARNPGAIRAFFAANREAILYAKAHREELIAYGVTELGLSEAVVKTYFNTYVPLWDESQKVDVPGMLNAIKYVKDLGYIDRGYKPDLAAIADLRFVNQKS